MITARTSFSRGAIASLLVGHCAGMLDLVALPLWVGALIGWFHFDAQQAGLVVSLFLAGQVISSVVLAPKFQHLPLRLAAVGGFAVAGLSFFAVSGTRDYMLIALLHLTGGLGAGCALSVTHGTIGRSSNPHRLFALAGFTLSLFGIFLLGGGSKLSAALGGSALFVLFAAVMLVAVVVCALAFPALPAASAGSDSADLPRQAWFGMVGMGLLALSQAMTFSFVERIGIDRGYGVQAVTAVLIAVAIVGLVPGPLAGLLQNKVRAERVVLAGPLLHALIVFTLTRAEAFVAYSVLVPLLIAVVIFTHTFLFGLLSRLDGTGRAVAATPAMLMIGAAVGPVLGGTAVKLSGYPAIGTLVVCVGLLSAFMFYGARPPSRAA